MVNRTGLISQALSPPSSTVDITPVGVALIGIALINIDITLIHSAALNSV
jgi:hypothetical protein